MEAEVSKTPGVVLGRLDVEQNQELAQQLQLQQIPTAFAIHQKRVCVFFFFLSLRERGKMVQRETCVLVALAIKRAVAQDSSIYQKYV